VSPLERVTLALAMVPSGNIDQYFYASSYHYAQRADVATATTSITIVIQTAGHLIADGNGHGLLPANITGQQLSQRGSFLVFHRSC
jgi:hypothetical protein